jgi:hypothetical protein
VARGVGVHAWQAGVWTQEYPSRVQVQDPVARPSHSSQVRIQEHDQQENVVPKTLNLETISKVSDMVCSHTLVASSGGRWSIYLFSRLRVLPR